MLRLADLAVANIELVLALMALTMGLVGLVYVLAWERRLLASPVSKLVLVGTAATFITSVVVGVLKHNYADDPEAVSWIEHFGPELLGSFMVAATSALTAFLLQKRLPETVRRFPRLHGFVRSAPAGVSVGWVLGALVLFVAPPPTINVVADLAPWAFAYRAFVQLPALVYAAAMLALPLLVHQTFGDPRNETQLALKRRFVPLVAGGACWVLLYLTHLALPFVALLWPASQLGRAHYWYLEAMMPPILTALVGSYLVMLLRPYRPSGLALIDRYGALTTRLSFRASDLVGDGWMSRYRFKRARRLIELAGEELGLPHEDRARAIDTYAVTAVAKVGAATAVEPSRGETGAQPLTRQDLEEISQLHGRFLSEQDRPASKPSALENRYAPLIPDALLLTDEPSHQSLRAHPLHLQLTAAAAAEAGLISPDHAATVDTRVLHAYEHAKEVTDPPQTS